MHAHEKLLVKFDQVLEQIQINGHDAGIFFFSLALAWYVLFEHPSSFVFVLIMCWCSFSELQAIYYINITFPM